MYLPTGEVRITPSSLCWKCFYHPWECESFKERWKDLKKIVGPLVLVSFGLTVRIFECNEFKSSKEVLIERMKRKDEIIKGIKKERFLKRMLLTEREKQIVELRKEGYTFREIGDRIGTSYQAAQFSYKRSVWKNNELTRTRI